MPRHAKVNTQEFSRETFNCGPEKKSNNGLRQSLVLY